MINNLIWGCIIVGCGAYSTYCLATFVGYAVEHCRRSKKKEGEQR